MRKTLGIKPRHFGMLKLLSAHDGRTQQELGEALEIHRNVMVGLVDDLEKRDLLERRRHPGDRRAHALRLLPAAHALLAEAEQRVAELDAELLSPLPPEDRVLFLDLLRPTAEGNGLRPGIHPGLTR
ncbi:helix-turn-helix domain-containing protein [Nocardioides sp. NPDC023903]